MRKGRLLTALTFTGTLAFAQAPAQERALARSAHDAELTWGGCPSFMPAGCRLSVLHGDPGKANADVLLELPASATIPDHTHTSAERMVLIAGELHVTYKGQAKAALKPGMYAYGPARLPHQATCVSSAPCLLFIAFESAVDAIPTEASKK